MVSKEVAMDLKKYKMNAGVKPSAAKRSKSKGDESPTAVRFEDQARQQRSHGRSNDLNKSGIEEAAFHNSVKKLLRDLDNGVAEKITLMQMLVHKCDETDSSISRLQNAINNGSMDTVER